MSAQHYRRLAVSSKPGPNHKAAKKTGESIGGYVEATNPNGIQAWLEGIIVIPQQDKPDLRIDILTHILGTNEKDLKDSSLRLHIPVQQGNNVIGHLPVTEKI